MDILIQDIRYGVKPLGKHKGLSLVAIVSLAIDPVVALRSE